MLKRIVIWVVILTMVIPCLHSVPIFADSAAKLYFYEDFDYGGNGNITNTMTFSTKAQRIVIDGEDDKAVRIQVNSDASNPTVSKSFANAPLTGKVIIEADICITDMYGGKYGDNYFSPKVAMGSKDTGSATEVYLLSVYKLGSNGEITVRNAANSKIAIIEDGVNYKFSFAIDIDSCTYDIYIDGTKISENVNFKPNNYEFNEITHLDFSTKYCNVNCKTQYNIDDIRVYEGTAPVGDMAATHWISGADSKDIMSPSMMKLLSKDIIAFYKGSAKYIYNGSVLTNSIVINSADDIDALDLTGKKISSDKTGLTIIADDLVTIDWRNDKAYLSALCSELVYDRPTGSELIDSLKSKNLSHPRLMGDADDFARLKSEIANGGTKAEWYTDLKEQADAYLTQKVCTFPTIVNENTSFIDQAIELKEMAPCLALAYRIEGKENGRKYAERLAEELRAWANLEVWGAYSMLALGRATAGIAFAYDWCFDILDEIDRTLKTDIKTAVKNNFYTEITKDYYNISPRTRSYSWSLRSTGDNWNTTINTAVVMAAIAFGDEEGYGEEYAYLLDEAFNSIELAFNMLAPDGAWFEGPAYWTPTAETLVWFQASLDKVYGTSFGFMNVPGMKEAPYYFFNMSSSSGIFNFNFADYRGYPKSAILMYYANKFEDTSLTQLCINNYNKFKGEYDYYMTGDALLLSGDIPEITDISLPLDSYYRDTEAVTMRSSYDENREFFAGFHSGYNGAQNAQLDIGTFVVEAYGDRFITDFGPEEYDIADATGDKFKAYMNRAEGANTYIVNPDPDIYMDQELEADCFFQSFESNDISAFAITDMTAAYGGRLTSAKRGIKMTNNRGSVILRDEIVCKEPSEIYWGMHTPAKVTLKDNDKTALLEIDGNYMEAKILSDDGEFIRMDAAPIDGVTFGPIPNESTHEDITKLAMHFENAESLDITICFTPLGSDKDKDITYPLDVALGLWELDELSVTEFSINETQTGANATVALNGSSAFYPEKLSLIIAAYDSDNELSSIAFDEQEIQTGKNTFEVSFAQNFVPGSKQIKAFLIDMSDLKPYHASIKNK